MGEGQWLRKKIMPGLVKVCACQLQNEKYNLKGGEVSVDVAQVYRVVRKAKG